MYPILFVLCTQSFWFKYQYFKHVLKFYIQSFWTHVLNLFVLEFEIFWCALEHSKSWKHQDSGNGTHLGLSLAPRPFLVEISTVFRKSRLARKYLMTFCTKAYTIPFFNKNNQNFDSFWSKFRHCSRMARKALQPAWIKHFDRLCSGAAQKRKTARACLEGVLRHAVAFEGRWQNSPSTLEALSTNPLK